ALAEDAHLDQQLALLLAGPADRLEGLIALRLGDQPLAREDLPEALGGDVGADRDRLATIEVHDLLGLAVEQIQAAGTLGPRELADQLGERAPAQRALEGEAEAIVSGLRHERGRKRGGDRRRLGRPRADARAWRPARPDLRGPSYAQARSGGENSRPRGRSRPTRWFASSAVD